MNLTDRPMDKGNIAEAIAKLLLWKNGCNVYSRFLDKEAIDMVVRTQQIHQGSHLFKEIQVKFSRKYPDSSKDHYEFRISKSTFEARENFYFMFICDVDDRVIIIPSTILGEQLHAIRTRREDSSWRLHIEQIADKFTLTSSNIKILDVSDYVNNYDSLH